MMAILALGTNYCIRALLLSVDYVFARENGMEYDADTGKYRLAPQEDPATGRNGSVNSSSVKRIDSNGVGDERAPLHAGGASSDEQGDEFDHSVTAIPLQSRASASASPKQVVVASVVPAPGTPSSPRPHSSASGLSSTGADPLTSTPCYTFREIGGAAFGRWGQLAVDVNLVASQLGFCIAYMSFISQNMDQVVPSLSRVAWIGILFAGWSLLTQIRKIETIAFTSGFGNLVYFASLSIIFYDGFAHACCVPTKEVTWVRGQGLALVFGTGCFALEGIGLVLPVKRAMKDQGKFGFILNIAISIVASCYILFGVLGYLFYGDNVRSVITDNLASGALSDAVRVSLSISLFFTYAIQLFPVSDMADSLWDKHVFYKKSAESYQALDGAPNNEEEHANANGAAAGRTSPVSYDTFPHGNGAASPESPSQLRDGAVHKPAPAANGTAAAAVPIVRASSPQREFALIATRVLLVAFTAGISIAFPNFGLIVSLVGSFSNSAIAFILPQLFYLRLVQMHPERSAASWADAQSGSKWRKYKGFVLPSVIIVLGVCASIIGVYTTIHEMVEGVDN